MNTTDTTPSSAQPILVLAAPASAPIAPTVPFARKRAAAACRAYAGQSGEYRMRTRRTYFPLQPFSVR